jgi:SAM-dependent methyltransferase
VNEAWWQPLLGDGLQPRLEDGIWRLHPQRDDQFFADYLSDEFLAELLRRARATNWRTAVEESLPRLRPDIAAYTRDYFLEPYRAAFVDALGIERGSSVLDLGCGWGFASQRCLERGASVIGTDSALGRLQFCSVRFSQQQFADRFLGIEMDANRPFPFQPGSFDALIVSGLMEWLPMTAMGSAESVQRQFLQRCADALKPGGRLYFAIENRWWWKYFLGARDLHRIHRLQVLTSILPRRLARTWATLVTGQDYRTYTYSFAEYLEMLRDVGFAEVDANYPQPDYVQPRTQRILCRGLRLDGATPDLAGAVRKQHAPAHLVHFGRSFTFIATK